MVGLGDAGIGEVLALDVFADGSAVMRVRTPEMSYSLPIEGRLSRGRLLGVGRNSAEMFIVLADEWETQESRLRGNMHAFAQNGKYLHSAEVDGRFSALAMDGCGAIWLGYDEMVAHDAPKNWMLYEFDAWGNEVWRFPRFSVCPEMDEVTSLNIHGMTTWIWSEWSGQALYRWSGVELESWSPSINRWKDEYDGTVIFLVDEGGNVCLAQVRDGVVDAASGKLGELDAPLMFEGGMHLKSSELESAVLLGCRGASAYFIRNHDLVTLSLST